MDSSNRNDPQAEDRVDLIAARDGDHEAGRRLVIRHGGSMDRTARSVLGRWAGTEADDIVQEALVAALTTSALPAGDVGAWLRAIVVRKALDQARRRVRRAEDPIEPDERGGPALTRTTAEPAADSAITARQLLGLLSADERAILVLADVEGRSMAEIAETLGSTRVAVKLRASRARRRLAARVREESARIAGPRSRR